MEQPLVTYSATLKLLVILAKPINEPILMLSPLIKRVCMNHVLISVSMTEQNFEKWNGFPMNSTIMYPWNLKPL
jgi:hypothetical protein